MCAKYKNAKSRILLGILGYFVVKYITLKAIACERKNRG